MECQSVFRQARKVLPRPMKPIISDPLAGSLKALEVNHTSKMDIQYYKNISIYSVELPATPAKFREKYTRDYLPQIQLPPEETEQNIPQVPNDPSDPSVSREPSMISVRRPSTIARLLEKARGPESSEPKTTGGRNASGLRSMLQRHISRTPAARLNFHTSAQERYSSRRSKKELSDLGNGVTLPTYMQQPLDIVLPPPPGPVSTHLDSWSRRYDSRGFPLPPGNSSSANPHIHHLATSPPPPPRPALTTQWFVPPPPPGPPPRHFDNFRLSYDSRGFPLPPGNSFQITGTKAHDFDEKLLSIQDDSTGSHDSTLSIPLLSPPPSTSSPSTILLPDYLSTGLDLESWTLEKVILWLREHNFSQDWISTFIFLNIHGSIFLELGSGHGGRGNFGMMHQQVYPRLAKECSNSGTGWDPGREREEGKRLRGLIRAIVGGRNMALALPSSDTDQQLVSASITSYNDLQVPESLVSTP